MSKLLKSSNRTNHKAVAAVTGEMVIVAAAVVGVVVAAAVDVVGDEAAPIRHKCVLHQ